MSKSERIEEEKIVKSNEPRSGDTSIALGFSPMKNEK